MAAEIVWLTFRKRAPDYTMQATRVICAICAFHVPSMIPSALQEVMVYPIITRSSLNLLNTDNYCPVLKLQLPD